MRQATHVVRRCDLNGECVRLWAELWGVVWVGLLGSAVAGYFAYQHGGAWLWGIAGVAAMVTVCEWRTLRTPDSGWAGPVELGLMVVLGLWGLQLVDRLLREGRSVALLESALVLGAGLVTAIVLCRWNDRWCEMLDRDEK